MYENVSSLYHRKNDYFPENLEVAIIVCYLLVILIAIKAKFRGEL